MWPGFSRIRKHVTVGKGRRINHKPALSEARVVINFIPPEVALLCKEKITDPQRNIHTNLTSGLNFPTKLLNIILLFIYLVKKQ